MRYEKSEKIVKLCLLMSSRVSGVTLADIQEEFSVSRRTAERMRNAALRVAGDHEEWTDDEGFKHWRIQNDLRSAVHLNPAEIASLELAADALRADNNQEAAATLSGLALKLTAAQSRQRQLTLEPDIELLLQSQGLALRPGPRVKIPDCHVRKIQRAILASVLLSVRYEARLGGEESAMLLEPYGVLYGPRPYLVARRKGKQQMRLFRLQGLKEIEITETPFEPDEGFDLNSYRLQSFGVFREQPFDVKWRFRPSAAKDAAEYEFHPNQSLEMEPDGSLLVSFRAGGALEMAWHLLTWGDAVEVIEPEGFWERAKLSRDFLVNGVNVGAKEEANE